MVPNSFQFMSTFFKYCQAAKEVPLEDWQVAFSMAAQAMCNHGIEIACPWEGDLDDVEMERYNGMVAAIDSYLTVFPPSKARSQPIPEGGEK